MEETHTMSKERKGVFVALIAGLAAVGICYFLSAVFAPLPAAEHPAQNRHLENSKGKPLSAALVSQGAGLYAQGCVSCHGDGGAGGYGPRLINIDLSEKQISSIIVHGIKPKMPALGDKYSPQQIQAITAYVQSLKKSSSKAVRKARP